MKKSEMKNVVTKESKSTAKKASKNSSLNKARKRKADDFYTLYKDVENEVVLYAEQLRNKVVYCCCDNPHTSQIVAFLIVNFNKFGLKRLIATCYAGSGTTEKGSETKGYYLDLVEVNDSDIEGHNVSAVVDKNTMFLNGDGRFQSDECIELLKLSDVVITNPPFSLFGEFVNLLNKYNKQFLILGNQNAIGHKNVFPLFRQNKIHLGVTGGHLYFLIPTYYPLETGNFKIDEKGNRYVQVPGVRWFTNMEPTVIRELYFTGKKYNSDNYKVYDNFDAINVDHIAAIPDDYMGVMGVPITFMTKFNPEQFKIVGISKGAEFKAQATKVYTKEDMEKYSKYNNTCTIKEADGTYKSLYTRIFIKRKTFSTKSKAVYAERIRVKADAAYAQFKLMHMNKAVHTGRMEIKAEELKSYAIKVYTKHDVKKHIKCSNICTIKEMNGAYRTEYTYISIKRRITLTHSKKHHTERVWDRDNILQPSTCTCSYKQYELRFINLQSTYAHLYPGNHGRCYIYSNTIVRLHHRIRVGNKSNDEHCKDIGFS